MKNNEEIFDVTDDLPTGILKPLGEDDADPSPKEIFNAIVNLSASHQKLLNDVYKFHKETSEFIKVNKTNIEKIPNVIEVQAKQGERITKLEKQLEFMQQKEKDNNLVIHDVPKVSTEKLSLVFRKITKILLGVDGLDLEFISAIKVKPNSTDHPILARLTHLKDKEILLKKKKEKGDIYIEQLGFDVTKITNTKIFLSSQLI